MKQRTIAEIVEEIKNNIDSTISKAGKVSEQMFVNLQKKDLVNDFNYQKPDTPLYFKVTYYSSNNLIPLACQEGFKRQTEQSISSEE